LVKDQKDARQSWRLGLVGRLVHHSRRLAKNPKMLVEANPDGWIRKIGASQPSLGAKDPKMRVEEANPDGWI